MAMTTAACGWPGWHGGPPAAEQQFAWQHAAKWAHGPWRTTASAAEELFADARAVAYADWYMGAYVQDAESMDDLPPHSRVWPEFCASEV